MMIMHYNYYDDDNNVYINSLIWEIKCLVIITASTIMYIHVQYVHLHVCFIGIMGP